MSRALESVAQRRFTVEEYHRLAETGILGPDERVELIHGVIREVSPKNRAHVLATRAIFLGLERALRGRASVYFEAPLDAARIDSEPEPDVLVCSNPDEWAYRSQRTKPVLVIEVADPSLEHDLGEKAGLYAVVGVPEYWVVNLIDRVLVVFREPDEGSYRVRFSLEESSRVTPAAWPELSFAVSDFLPRNSPTESETAG
jgi:Uma2 family endonuclease